MTPFQQTLNTQSLNKLKKRLLVIENIVITIAFKIPTIFERVFPKKLSTQTYSE